MLEVEVILTNDPFMTPAEIFRIVEPLSVVGHRARSTASAADECRRSACRGKLTDRDAESSGPLIAGAEDALTVGHDDDIDLGTRAAPQEFGDRTAPIANKIFSGAAIDVG